MSKELFALALAIGAGLVAMWAYVRFPGLAPTKMGKTLLHAGAAFGPVGLAEFIVADRLRRTPAGVHESLSGLGCASPGAAPDRHRKEQRRPRPLDHFYVSPFEQTLAEGDLFDAKTAPES